MALIFAAAIFVGGFADFVGFKEENLGDAFVGIYLGGERGGVGELKGDVAFPLGLEGRDVDDDAAAGVGAFSETNGEDVAGYAEVFDRAREGEAVGWDDDVIVFDVKEVFGVEVFGIDDGAVDVGEEFEFVGAANVIAVA